MPNFCVLFMLVRNSMLSTPQGSILDLPSELVGYIASFLPIEDISRGSRTCKLYTKWFWMWLEELEIINKNPTEKEFEHLILTCKRLESLYLSHIFSFTNDFLNHLSNTPLVRLTLNFCHHVDDIGLLTISKMTSLREVSIECNFKITSDGIQLLSNLQLKSLNLRGCSQLCHQSVKWISLMTTLEILNLSECSNIVTGPLDMFSSLQGLKELYMARCNLKDTSMLFLKDLEHLKVVDLHENAIGQETIEVLSSKESIKSINLSGNLPIGNDASLKSIGEMKNLEDLNIQKCGSIEGESISHLLNLRNVRHLLLSDVRKHLPTQLHQLSNLTKLSLATCDISNNNMPSLGRLTNLVYLDLTGCFEITNHGIMCLSELTKLEYLNLSLLNLLSHKGLSHLLGLGRLKTLKMAFCTNMTDQIGPILMKFEKLENLSLESCRHITSNIIPYILLMKGLRKLCVTNCKLLDQAKFNKRKDLRLV